MVGYLYPLIHARNPWLWVTLVSLVWFGLPRAYGQDAGATDARDALEHAATLLHRGQAQPALDALKTVEKLEPDNPWMWFYRGSAYLQLRRPYDAMAAFDRALAVLAELGDPDPQLAEATRRHRLRARREVFGFAIQTGLAYDTNVTFLEGGASSLGLIAGRDDGLFASTVRMDYAPISDGTDTLTVGARLGHSWHFAVEQFDFQDYGAYVRYARRLDEHWEVALRYDYDMMLLGNESFLSNHVVSPSVTYTYARSAEPFQLDRTSLHYVLEGRDYLFDVSPPFDNDGFLNGVGIEQHVKIHPLADVPWTCDLGLGYRFDSVATEGTEFDRLSNTFFVALSCPLLNPASPDRYLILPDKELRLRFSANAAWDNYRKSSLIDARGEKRDDRIWTFGWVLTQKLIDDAKLGNLLLHAIINLTDAHSNVRTEDNIEPFAYDRVVYGVQLEWNW